MSVTVSPDRRAEALWRHRDAPVSLVLVLSLVALALACYDLVLLASGLR